MRNIKDQIYEALSSQFDNVSDMYPTDWRTMPAIQLTEEENSAFEITDEGEETAYIRYRIDIWDNASTSAHAVKVDAILGNPKDAQKIDGVIPQGFKRTTCQDVPDPSGRKHKLIRYEGVINYMNDYVEYR